MRAHEFDQPQAAGCILYAEDTGRWGLQQRSDTVNDPGVWAAWGGGREPGESLEQCVRRELAEESGYRGPIKLEPLARNAKYVTYIGIVPREFEPRPCDEWKDYCWVELGRWPAPLHPGVAAALDNVYIKEGLAEGSNQDDKKIEIFQHLKQMPLTVFGSTVTKSFQEANDFDVFLDLDQNPTHKKFVRPVLNLARKYYGWIDPFVLKDGVLYVRNDEATGWTRSKNAKAILQQIRAHGKSIDDIEEQGVAENFADGKVQGKSRPGRVKRSGASCSGSVTDLRAKARKYGGERGKMYHWCANMKGGKKK
jgi:8-oxo-dGTP pyrophosphatase MutT (NUDIX family)/predicted nucleotidyltransferase